jgi:HSP20 family protein
MKLIPWKRKGHTGDHLPARVEDEFSDLVRRFWEDPWTTSLTDRLNQMVGSAPRMDMVETEHELSLRFEVPGMKAEDVNVQVTGNLLTLSGEKKEERESRKGGTTYSERSYGSFSRSVTLPSAVDPQRVEATCRDGVLTISIPKHRESKPRRVTVRKS